MDIDLVSRSLSDNTAVETSKVHPFFGEQLALPGRP